MNLSYAGYQRTQTPFITFEKALTYVPRIEWYVEPPITTKPWYVPRIEISQLCLPLPKVKAIRPFDKLIVKGIARPLSNKTVFKHHDLLGKIVTKQSSQHGFRVAEVYQWLGVKWVRLCKDIHGTVTRELTEEFMKGLR